MATKSGKLLVLDKPTPLGDLLNRLVKIKAAIRAKVVHPFRVIKCQFGYVKVRHRGLFKNTAQLTTLMALANLWVARKRIDPHVLREVRLQAAKWQSDGPKGLSEAG